MRKIRGNLFIIAVLGVAILLTACASTQTQNNQSSEYQDIVNQLLALHDKYVEAIQTMKLKSKDIAGIAAFEYGLVSEGLGVDLQNIPGEALSILERYKSLALKDREAKEFTDRELGQIAGMRLRFIYKMSEWMILKVGPGLIKALTLALG